MPGDPETSNQSVQGLIGAAFLSVKLEWSRVRHLDTDFLPSPTTKHPRIILLIIDLGEPWKRVGPLLRCPANTRGWPSIHHLRRFALPSLLPGVGAGATWIGA